MRKTVLNCLLGLVLLFASQQACLTSVPAVPNSSALDPNSIDTAIAGTMIAALTETGQPEILTPSLTPTITPTLTLSPTPFPTFTVVVASAPLIHVLKSTNCRAGPGTVYKKIAALKAGSVVQAVGRSRDGNYWIIRSPNHSNTLCWLSGKYASVTGVAGMLPILTPPPTPKPTRTAKPSTRTPRPVATSTLTTSFTAAYSNTINCTGSDWYVQVLVTNDGPTTFQSIFMAIQDTVTGEILTASSDDFTASNGCSSDTADTLPPGSNHLISLPPLTADPLGHYTLVALELCSEPAQGGSCSVQVIDFIP